MQISATIKDPISQHSFMIRMGTRPVKKKVTITGESFQD